MRLFQLFLVCLCFVTTPMLALAEEAALASTPETGDPISIDLLTMGPGDHPFFKFGHNAIRVRDSAKRSDNVYNYGTFSFQSNTLIQDFFKGRLEYWLSRDSMTKTVYHYSVEDRSMLAQHLALSPTQKQALKAQLETNALPENRKYKYDYFFDNCSTRVRDAIDRVTEGRLHESMRAPATQTLRAHALRVTADYFLEYLILSIGLGPLVDKPYTAWDEAFLPEMLTAGIRKATILAPDGSVRPLVANEEVLLAHEDDQLKQPPRWTLRFYVAGTLAGLCLLGLARLAYKQRLASVVLGLILVLGGAVVGLLGMGLLLLWTSTDHAVAYRNQNLLLLSPLSLALVWYGTSIAVRGVISVSRMRWLTRFLVVSSTIALVWKVLPFEWQDNATLIAFFLPCWIGLWAASEAAQRFPVNVEAET